jgi:hypothetical protein
MEQWRAGMPTLGLSSSVQRCSLSLLRNSPADQVLSCITRPLLLHSRPTLRLYNNVCRARPTLYATPEIERPAQPRLGETSCFPHVARI